MKIYANTPMYLIRLQIIKQGEKTEYLTLVDTTINEVEAMCKKVLEKQNISIFETGKKTMIVIRESTGGVNGKSKNVSFRGLSPKKTLDIIIKELKTIK